MKSYLSYLNEEKIKEQIQLFAQFAAEHLGLEQVPTIKIKTDSHLPGRIPTFGQYSPMDKTITISTKGRHIMDTFRTLAHEMVHFSQDAKNQLHSESGITGSEHENEANSEAGIIMRKFAISQGFLE